MRPRPPAWSTHRILYILLALALVRGLIYVALVPPWQHYDEPGHFEYAAYLARHHRPPNPKVLDIDLRFEIVASMAQQRFATYQPTWSPTTNREDLHSPEAVPLPQFQDPPLYYWLGAIPLSLLSSQAVELQLYALRLMSVALNLLLLIVAAATLDLLLPGRKEILYGVLLFIIFLPAHSDVDTAINNDVLANLLFTGLIYLLIRQVMAGASWQLGLATVVTFLLCLYTKRTTAIGLLTILVALLMYSKQRGRRYFWVAALILAILGLLGGIAVFEWHPDRGLNLSPSVDRYLFWGSFPSFLDSLLDWQRSWPVYKTTGRVIFNGFWGHFSWGTQAFTSALYRLLLLVTLVALAGVARLLAPVPSKPLRLDSRQRQGLWLLVLTLALAWLAAFLRVHPISPEGWTYIPRARYTYVAIVPAAVLFVVGLRAWLPTRWRGWLVIGLAVGGLLLDTLFLTKYLLPFYLG